MENEVCITTVIDMLEQKKTEIIELVNIIMLKMHNVSEKWLRTGTGDIMTNLTRDDQQKKYAKRTKMV